MTSPNPRRAPRPLPRPRPGLGGRAARTAAARAPIQPRAHDEAPEAGNGEAYAHRPNLYDEKTPQTGDDAHYAAQDADNGEPCASHQDHDQTLGGGLPEQTQPAPPTKRGPPGPKRPRNQETTTPRPDAQTHAMRQPPRLKTTLTTPLRTQTTTRPTPATKTVPRPWGASCPRRRSPRPQPKTDPRRSPGTRRRRSLRPPPRPVCRDSPQDPRRRRCLHPPPLT